MSNELAPERVSHLALRLSSTSHRDSESLVTCMSPVAAVKLATWHQPRMASAEHVTAADRAQMGMASYKIPRFTAFRKNIAPK